MRLSSGDIAISGGPSNFEVIIYQPLMASEEPEKGSAVNYKFKESINTNGHQVW